MAAQVYEHRSSWLSLWTTIWPYLLYFVSQLRTLVLYGREGRYGLQCLTITHDVSSSCKTGWSLHAASLLCRLDALITRTVQNQKALEMLLVTWDKRIIPRVVGLKRMPSPALHWPIFHRSELVMVAGHTKPPRLGPSNISATGMSPKFKSQNS